MMADMLYILYNLHQRRKQYLDMDTIPYHKDTIWLAKTCSKSELPMSHKANLANIMVKPEENIQLSYFFSLCLVMISEK